MATIGYEIKKPWQIANLITTTTTLVAIGESITLLNKIFKL